MNPFDSKTKEILELLKEVQEYATRLRPKNEIVYKYLKIADTQNEKAVKHFKKTQELFEKLNKEYSTNNYEKLHDTFNALESKLTDHEDIIRNLIDPLRKYTIAVGKAIEVYDALKFYNSLSIAYQHPEAYKLIPFDERT